MFHNRFQTNYQKRWWEDFRINGFSFQKLFDVVSSRLRKNGSIFRNAIATEKRVAIALWRLATGNFYRTICKTFTFGKSTAVSIVRNFYTKVKIISSVLKKLPETIRETATAIEEFVSYSNCKVPQVVGAIDSTHVGISTPHTNSKIDRMESEIINTQAVVRADLRCSYRLCRKIIQESRRKTNTANTRWDCWQCLCETFDSREWWLSIT